MGSIAVVIIIGAILLWIYLAKKYQANLQVTKNSPSNLPNQRTILNHQPDLVPSTTNDEVDPIKNVDNKSIITSEHEQLLNRLERVLKIEYATFFEEWGLEKSLGYPLDLIPSIPLFALKVLEKVSDKDIVIATRAILLGISHCPNCSYKINPSAEKCLRCNATIPKESVYIKGINVMPVGDDTKELLSSILCKQIYVDGAIKNLEVVPKVENSMIDEIIIASLFQEVRVCPDCGLEVTPFNAQYCWNCGSKIEDLSSANTGKNITVSLPLTEYVITTLNKLALEELKEIDEFDYNGQVIIQDFCDVLIKNEIASAQLCKKVGALFAKFKEYETAMRYYEAAMNIDSTMDLSAQIERLEKKLYDY